MLRFVVKKQQSRTFLHIMWISKTGLQLKALRLKTQQKTTCRLCLWLHEWESQHILQKCEYSNRPKKRVPLWQLLEGYLLGINNSSSTRWNKCNVNVSCIAEIFALSVTQFAYCMALIQLPFFIKFVKSEMCPFGLLENQEWKLILSQKEIAVDSVPTTKQVTIKCSFI